MEENDTSHRSPASQQVVEAEETGETEVLVQPEQVHHRQPRISRHDHRQPRVVSYRFTINASNEVVRNDVWSCLAVLLTFWFFASITLILGFYGSFNLQLGPNSSYLIQARPIFVHAIKVQQLSDHIEGGPMLYGFHKSPPLDAETTWSQNHTASVEPNFHTEWAYYLNAGSQINISYDVKFPRSTSLYFVIAQGREALLDWIDYPNANSTLSWKIIYGKGNISQDIKQPDRYYVAVGNLNLETVGVDLNIVIRSVNYNTSDSYFKCSLSNHACTFKLHLIKPNAAVLTSPLVRQRTGEVNKNDDWYFKVSFVPMWVTYIGGSCILTVLILGLFQLCCVVQSNNRVQSASQRTESRTQRDPLLSPKGDDSSSQGSSYDSLTNDEEDPQENLLEASIQGKLPKEGESPRHMCVICFDAPRDCFFLPCGHCAACFTCGSRMAEEAGTCPICRRKMKKVRRIFPV